MEFFPRTQRFALLQDAFMVKKMKDQRYPEARIFELIPLVFFSNFPPGNLDFIRKDAKNQTIVAEFLFNGRNISSIFENNTKP